ncbi:MAG: ribbon-helix-helix protein, CopG family [Deltaproteobacteria bacterium]|nr:ribbon-helix-helix protein, CopG family [Deltaproteobacteria bacterium]
MGQSIKTAISVPESLFKKVSELAKDLHMSRSKVFSLAVEEFIKKKESEKLLRQLNAAYSGESPEERAVGKRHKKKHGKRAATEPW